MIKDREAVDTMELEGMVKETAEALIPSLIALAFTLPSGRDRGRFRALAVADDFDGGLRRELRTLKETKVEFLVVNRKLFESDVKASSLLEISASNLLLPYKDLVGKDYLTRWERSYKRRKIKESLAGLVLDHPDLSSELLIDPLYFVYDIFLRLSHILPHASDLLRTSDNWKHLLLARCVEDLRELENEGSIHFVNSFVAIDRGFVDAILVQDSSPSYQLIQVEKQLRGLLKFGTDGLIDLLRIVPSLSLIEGFKSALKDTDLMYPDCFLYFPTATGLTSLSESTEIEKVIGSLTPSGQAENIQIWRIGGVFNEVYMLSYDAEETRNRTIIKRYPTWSSVKWAPLALWTLGTQNFAVLGRSRLERECATTSLLIGIEIPVPKILYTSFKDRLLLREYVEGENLTDVIKNAVRKGRLGDRDVAILRRVGGIVATVHGAEITLGDCKPENFITQNNDPYIIDLEQGSRGGNKTWDVAEFLYFSGHYAGLLEPLTGIAEVTQSFIDGYLDGGGDKRRVADAAKLKYTKVFTPLTLPHVIHTIAKTCLSQVE